MSLVQFSDTTRPVDKFLWRAIGDGDEALVRILLDQQRASVTAKNLEQRNALHLAVVSGHEPIVQLLLSKGVDIEAAGGDGKKPLYIAAESGSLSMASLLLRFNANVESFNVKKQLSALYKAVQNRYEAVAQLLLQHGAEVDMRTPNGKTPLFDSVMKGDTKLTALLLQFGANKDIRSQDGRSVLDIATGDDAITSLLKKAYILKGPSVIPGKTVEEFRFSQIPTPPTGENQVYEANASQGFEMTIVDFFIGKHEQRVVHKAPIWDILYGQHPESMRSPSKESLMSENEHTFRWYHFPANNMAWVEALVSRLSAEQKSGAAMLTDSFKSNLGLTNAAGQQYQTATAQSSFMRPLCRFVKSGPETSFGDGSGDHVMLFMPYLHFEYYNDYRKMSKIISSIKTLTDRGIGVESPKERLMYTRMSRRHLSLETLNTYGIDYELDRNPEYVVIKRWVPEFEQDILWGHTKKLRERRWASARRKSRDAESLSTDEDSDWARKRHTKRAFRQQIFGEAKKRVRAAAKILMGGSVSDYSDTDSYYTSDSGSSHSSDGSSTPDEETHHEMKKILLGSERLATALQELKDKFKGNREGNESSRKLEKKEEDSGNVTSGHHASDDNLAGSTEETRIVLRRAMTDLETNIESRSKRPRNGRREKNLDVDESKARGSTHSVPSQPMAEQDRGRKERRVHHREIYGPGPSSLGLASSQPRVSGEENSHRPRPYTEHSKSFPGLPAVDNASSKATNEFPQKNSTPKSEKLTSPSQEETIPYKIGAITGLGIRREVAQSGNENEDYGNVKTTGNPAPASKPSKPQRDGKGPEKRKISRERKTPRRITAPPPVRKTADFLNECLIKGYFFPKAKKLPFLQPRRTLDQYFYTHLENTSKRDSDQVVYRYTKRGKISPRIFMVDQLWLWILNEGKLLLLSPNLKSSWSENVLADPEKPLAPVQDDALNVHQMVFKSLKQPFRAPIMSAYDLANLITDSCASVFDPFKVPDEFQFLDFFERSIGAVSDSEANCFQKFTESLGQPTPQVTESDPRFNITKEINLLVEIKDIRDELSILQMVLNQQISTMTDLSKTCAYAKAGKPTEALKLVDNEPATPHKVLEHHLWRVTRMDQLAEKTYLSLSNLIDLKQNQASMSEALSARKQAENTFRQAENTSRQADYAARQAESTAEQAAASADQAAETTRQGKTILVFTVVTIIFLPLSFMAAFFAIAINSFPWDDSGRLGLGYVLKYMLSVSSAISIPLILIAFNQDRMARWLARWLKLRRSRGGTTKEVD